MEEAWWPLWRDGCTKAGLKSPSREHGISVQDGAQAAHYISKWGLDSELTKDTSRRENIPHALGSYACDDLRAGSLHDLPELRETLSRLGIDKAKARGLWIVYAKAFKGQRQLIWSVGLRDLLNMKKKKRIRNSRKRILKKFLKPWPRSTTGNGS